MNNHMNWTLRHAERLQAHNGDKQFDHEYWLERVRNLGVDWRVFEMLWQEDEEPRLSLPQVWAMTTASEGRLRDVLSEEDIQVLGRPTVLWLDGHLEVAWDETAPIVEIV